MRDTFSSRTVAIVALASLLAGFVAVFAGGMVLFAPATRAPPAPPLEPAAVRAPVDAGPLAQAADPEPDGGAVVAASPGNAAAPGAAGVRFSPSAVSRCWDAGNPAVIAGASCDRLQGLDDHFAAHAAEIAGCARGHGRLAFIMDLRFSTTHVSSWGGPTSTIPNAGGVVACLRRVTQPLPFATTPHAHDRYLVVMPVEW